VPFAAHLDAALALVAEDADALGCAGEVAAARGIVNADTSADRQLAAFDEARGRGLDGREALGAVVDWLARATASDNVP
jgi:carboxylate-amine ligase